MVAGPIGNASEPVALDTLAVPLVGRVDLEDDVWRLVGHYNVVRNLGALTIIDLGLLQKLIVKRETEVLAVVHNLLARIVAGLQGPLSDMCHAPALVELTIGRVRLTVDLALVLKDPAALLRQQNLERNIGGLGLEAVG